MTMTTTPTPISGATPITRSTDSLDTSVARMLRGSGPVPHNMPSIVQLNMQFDCENIETMESDRLPLWVTPNGQDGNFGDMPEDVAHALERIARVVLCSSDVRDLVVNYVDEQGAQDDDAPGRLTMWLDLARGNDEPLRYVADMQLLACCRC